MPDVAGRPKVLVVDDERAIADTLALILNKNGFAASVAYSGEEAVVFAQLQLPDILITDVFMSGMNGIEAALEVCARAPKCRALLISGQSVTEELLKRAGADGHQFEILLKPVHPRALIDRLKISA